MVKIWVQGVVRNGQVVLDTPLDVPDGTQVFVTDFYELEDDPRPRPAPESMSPAVLAELVAYWRKEKTWDEAEKRIQELRERS